MKKIIIGCVGIIVLGILLVTAIALVLQKNPPVVQEPPWDSPRTRELASRACFDCHSNETRWPIWTKLPVGSWLAVFDTLRGRNEMNFSEWGVSTRREGGEREGGEREGGGDEIGEVIREGKMPPATYLLMHPEAKLTDTEKQELITGLENSLR